MTTTTLIRTRRRTRRPAPTAPAGAAQVVRAALAANEPVMLTVANYGRGWYAVAADDQGVTVRRHGHTMSVAWSAVEVDR